MNAIALEPITIYGKDDLQLSIDVLPYQINSISLQVELLTCASLSLSARIYWQYLYSQKDFHTHTVVYNRQRMARRFNVDPKTIKRGIEQLLRTGWLDITEYSKDGGIAEFQVTMPPDVYNRIMSCDQRKEGPLNYENRERNYCKDSDDNVLFTYYTNANGSQTIVLGEDLDISEVANMLKHGLINDVAANEVFNVSTDDLPTHEDLNKEVNALQNKISSPDLSNPDKYKLVLLRNAAMDKIKADKKKGDKLVPIPINKYTKKITKKNTISKQNVNYFFKKNNRYFAIANESEGNTPRKYRDDDPVKVPQHYRDKIKQAIETYRSMISDPNGVFDEMVWAISRQFVGKPKDRSNATFNDIMRFNTCVAIKLIQEGRWTMPAGFRSHAVIAAEKKTEVDKENKLRRRNNHNDYISSPMDMADLKNILGI